MLFARLRTATKTLRFQLMFWNALVVFVATAGTLLLMRVGVQFALVREFDQALKNDLREIADMCGVFHFEGRGRGDLAFLRRNLDRKARIHTQAGWFCELLEPRPNPETDSGKFLQPRKVYVSSGNVPEELADFFFPDSEPQELANYRVFAGTTYSRTREPVRIRVGASINSLQHTLKVLDRILILSGLGGLLIAYLGAYWLVIRATQPLAKIISLSERSRPSHLDERLPIRHTGDELDQLSLALNSMMDRIADYIAKNHRTLANSAHELRTPLAALRSTAEVALASERTAKEYERTLESIVDECKNLESLVNQLLLLAETENIAPKLLPAVDLSQLVTSACSMFEALAEIRETRFTCDISEGIYVSGNRMHLRQLINNLLDNAFKFTPHQGSVTVRLNASDSKSCCLSISDSGCGISPTEMSRLFERFYRGDPSRRQETPTRGTGLGLSICKAIVESYGGRLEVESKPSEGSCFKVILPLASSPPEETHTSIPSLQHVPS